MDRIINLIKMNKSILSALITLGKIYDFSPAYQQHETMTQIIWGECSTEVLPSCLENSILPTNGHESLGQ